jgi:cell division protein FtsW (lipid II flippase)
MTSTSASAAVAPYARPGRVARVVPQLIEWLMALAAMVLLLPSYERLHDASAGRDQRYADPGLVLQGLPETVLPAMCAAHGALAPASVRERLCGKVDAAAQVPVGQVPARLEAALVRVRDAFLAPLQQAEARAAELRLQQREGLGDLRGLADALSAIDERMQPYVARFHLGPEGPRPVACAARQVEAVLSGPVRSQDESGRAAAVLLLGAALDGHAGLPLAARGSRLPDAVVPAGCAAWPESVVQAASLMAGVRQSLSESRKNEAMRELLRTAGPQWGAWMGLVLVLVALSRQRIRPAWGVALSMAAWAVVAWLFRVPWPLEGRAFEPGRAELTWWSLPSTPVMAMGAIAVALGLWGASAPVSSTAVTPQAPSSRVGCAGLVLSTGLGWLLLLDLSAAGHPSNRYLALYHQGHLWLGLTVMSVLLFLRQPLGRGLAWGLSAGGELGRVVARRAGPVASVAMGATAALALVLLFGLALGHLRQLTSELGRVWLIVGAAWFFFLRGSPLAERVAQSSRPVASLLRYVAPLGFVVAVLVGAMFITRDMGPLLIAGYAAGAFLGAALAMWWQQRTGQAGRLAPLMAIAVFAAWTAATTFGLFRVGDADDVTAARLESLAAPMSSANDQMALVSWFREAAPRQGFGVGAVPWCGHSPGSSCGGVPTQIHSDYTFTAITGVYGETAAWVAALGAAWWLHRLVRRHGQVTRGEPRLVARGGRWVPEGQALLSWVTVAWVALTLCQLAVTVAGNLAVLPLTGVTFPFVSYGMTSLVLNFAFLALALNVDVPVAASRGGVDE